MNITCLRIFNVYLLFLNSVKKVLFVASVASHIESFHIPYIKWFKEYGFIVDVAARMNIDNPIEYCDKFIDIPFERSPYSKGNISAYKALKAVIYNGQYNIIHCHTPMAAALTRLATISLRKQGLKVIYTAHGFHFFKGAPLINWLIYYPVEQYLSRYTDILITINSEDFELAKRHHFKRKNIFLVPGIGVNTKSVIDSNDETKKKLRKSYGYSDNDFILFYAAEFIKRKNHRLIIEQLPALRKKIPNIKILLAGRGELLVEIKKLAEHLGVSRYVDFLGFRRDIPELVAMSDVGVSFSLQEGLGITVAEDMFAGLPVVVSYDRGHKEMVIDGFNGYFFDISKPEQFTDKIYELYRYPEKRILMGLNAKKSIQKFSIENALAAHISIYKSVIEKDETIS